MSKLSSDSINKYSRLTKFGYTSFLLLWTIALIFELLLLFFSHSLSIDQKGSSNGFTDFVHFYVAGKITLSPARSLFYSWEVQKQFLESLTHCSMAGEDFYTQYVPVVFLFMAPYCLLPMDCAHLLFDLVNTSIGLLGCWLVMKHFKLTGNRMAQLIVLGALASMPSWNTWFLGQISWLYVGIICFYFVFLLERKNSWAGLALAFSVIKPHYALFLLIPALVLGRYRLILFALGWEALLFAVCALTFGFQSMLAYPFALNQCESSFTSIKTSTMYGIGAFLSLFLSRSSTYYTGLALLALGLLAITLLIMFRLKDKRAISFNWLVSLIVLAALLFSPHTHSHDCLFMVIPALFTLPMVSNKQKSLSLTIWQWLLYLMPIITWFIHWFVAVGLFANFLLTILMLILFVCALKQFWTDNKALEQN